MKMNKQEEHISIGMLSHENSFEIEKKVIRKWRIKNVFSALNSIE